MPKNQTKRNLDIERKAYEILSEKQEEKERILKKLNLQLTASVEEIKVALDKFLAVKGH